MNGRFLLEVFVSLLELLGGILELLRMILEQFGILVKRAYSFYDGRPFCGSLPFLLENL